MFGQSEMRTKDEKLDEANSSEIRQNVWRGADSVNNKISIAAELNNQTAFQTIQQNRNRTAKLLVAPPKI